MREREHVSREKFYIRGRKLGTEVVPWECEGFNPLCEDTGHVDGVGNAQQDEWGPGQRGPLKQLASHADARAPGAALGEVIELIHDQHHLQDIIMR